MADQDFGAVFNYLATQMANVSSAVGTQGIAQVVSLMVIISSLRGG